ncbi:SOH1-domain-containing protein [Suillus plorans]|uniref:Mediator of RNA polymerase II transcription subunit 31 n=1 Tax=Suillus plorans TaxID=116603 RepID=A0A9P7DPJ0_9AGAM|nr:SOH1-domain-containing protein [Suillus plorans]KAG1799911.1 SOH1-domain-containing protein [Suillus plorans]
MMEASDPAQSPQATTEDPRAANRDKFELELEFVQSLANPYYLHSLAQQNILDQPAFINYLEYLTYWKEKDYARFIHYPHALHHLDLLQHAQFRSEMKKDEWREYLNQKQYDHWRTWRDYPGISTSVASTDLQETGVQSQQNAPFG